MIKKILVLIFFLFLIAIGTVDIIYINKSVSSAIESTDALRAMIENGEDLETIKLTANEMEQNWIKREKILTILMYYRDIDTLGKQINLVTSLVNENKLDEAKIEIGGLKYLLASTKKVSEFNLDNIL